MVVIPKTSPQQATLQTKALTKISHPASWPSECDRLVTPANRFMRPTNRFAPLHVREFTGTSPIRLPWSHKPKPLHVLETPLDLKQVPAHKPGAPKLWDLLQESVTDGLIVSHAGVVVAEYVGPHGNPQEPHSLTSASKSVIACVAAILIGRGLLDKAAPVERYLPELQGTGYEGVTVGQAFDMQSGVYSSGDDEFFALGWHPLQGDKRPVGLYQHVLSRPRQESREAVYASRSTDIDVIALACERVAEKPMTALVSELIWQPIGAEDDAYFELDRQGTAFFGGGLNASLRDMMRFGNMLQNNGRVGDLQVVPEAFVQDTRTITQELQDAFPGSFFGHPWEGAAYHNHFWLDPEHPGATLNFGAFGNMLYIDPTLNTVCMMNSAWVNMHADVMLWLGALQALSASAASK